MVKGGSCMCFFKERAQYVVSELVGFFFLLALQYWAYNKFESIES